HPRCRGTPGFTFLGMVSQANDIDVMRCVDDFPGFPLAVMTVGEERAHYEVAEATASARPAWLRGQHAARG
ncbi:MAG: hypothetical protein ACRDPW_05655, partial [Mycobacteriales bacterium]